jgi:septal ring factor EnvC (AmiA/AmiB activator)
MIADFARIPAVADAPRATVPWMLVAASLVLLALLLYAVFGGWLPAKQRIARLERELKQAYVREATLQTRLAQQNQRARDQQLVALRVERDELARRVAELEQELAALR